MPVGALRGRGQRTARRLRDPDDAHQSIGELAQESAWESGEAVCRVESTREGEEVRGGTEAV